MQMDISYIAKLARLHIDEEQLPKFEKDMEAIVEMVNHLPDTHDVLTLDADNSMKLRADIAEENRFTREEMLANAPEVQSGCLAVPKTVE